MSRLFYPHIIPTPTLFLAHWRTKAFFCRSALCSTRRATSQTVQAPTWRYIDSEICQLSKFVNRRMGRKMILQAVSKMISAPKKLSRSLMKLLPQGVSMATWGNFDSAASEGWPVSPYCTVPGHQFIEFSSLLETSIASLYVRDLLHLHKDFLLHFYLKLPGALVSHSFLCPPDLLNYVLIRMLAG